MSKTVLEAVERLVAEELTEEERLRLTKELLQRTRKDRWNRLFDSIDRKLKGRRPFTMAEINAEIAAVRRARRARPH